MRSKRGASSAKPRLHQWLRTSPRRLCAGFLPKTPGHNTLCRGRRVGLLRGEEIDQMHTEEEGTQATPRGPSGAPFPYL